MFFTAQSLQMNLIKGVKHISNEKDIQKEGSESKGG
jgi:hypothetical protein